MDIIHDGHSFQKIYAGSDLIKRVYAGSDLVWMPFMQQAPTERSWSTTGTYEFALPEWAEYVDIICLGGGSGGNGGDGAVGRYGLGGRAGTWMGRRYARADLADILTLTVGAGGAGGSKESQGHAGSATMVRHSNGTVLVTADGAPRPSSGYGNNDGQDAGTYWHAGYTFQGGGGGRSTGTTGANGGTGAGGAGGGGGFFGSAGPGGRGGAGAVWIRCYTAYRIEI